MPARSVFVGLKVRVPTVLLVRYLPTAQCGVREEVGTYEVQKGIAVLNSTSDALIGIFEHGLEEGELGLHL